jgi:AbiU2
VAANSTSLNQVSADPGDDISIFIDNCVFARSVYLHGSALFEQSTDRDKQRMSRTAGTLFGDLSQVIREYVILQVCKMTDPARDVRGNDNHTVAFLLEYYDFSSDFPLRERLTSLRAQLESFGAKLRPARNKLISHADRGARLAGNPLGGVAEGDWNQFWLDLQDFVCLIHLKVLGGPFYLNAVAGLTDAHGLLKALKHAECFDELSSDPSLTQRCADLALDPERD